VGNDGTFSVDEAKVKPAVIALARELLAIEATGDKSRAQALLAKQAVVRPEVQRVLDRLTDVPVDIEPKFTTAERLVMEASIPAAAPTPAQKPATLPRR
jgi:hypothetical protein